VDESFRACQRQALLVEDKPMVEAIGCLRLAVERDGLKLAMLARDAATARVSFELYKLERAAVSVVRLTRDNGQKAVKHA
jgi:hypothetical protein